MKLVFWGFDTWLKFIKFGHRLRSIGNYSVFIHFFFFGGNLVADDYTVKSKEFYLRNLDLYFSEKYFFMLLFKISIIFGFYI